MGLLKALLLASQGVEPVEANSDFIAEVDAAAGDACTRSCGVVNLKILTLVP